MISKEYPCTCGHQARVHRMDFIGLEGCMSYMEGSTWCGCYIFTPDNLRYLEKMDETKKTSL